METFPTPLTFTFLLQIQTLGRTLKQLSFTSSCPADTDADREKQLKVRHCYLYQLAGQVNIRPRAVELALVITFEKFKGKHWKKMILDLNSLPTRFIRLYKNIVSASKLQRENYANSSQSYFIKKNQTRAETNLLATRL